MVLASASPRRRRMLEDAGIPFEVVPADIDEKMRGGESPDEYARRTAGEKGQTVGARLREQGKTPWIVAADTVVVLDGRVLEKPRDEDEALEMLDRLEGRTHTVITGWTVGRDGGPWIVEHAETRVTFHELTVEQRRGYVATGEGMDKAGAYAIQDLGAFLVDRIDGNYFNVVGLPISHVVRALLEVGALPMFPLP
ncbi:MAG: septum formation protein Maf [Deltaproteobacteria bacterium]|nr:septum formation protein Maf [Deltaproteobacteria bacterium]